MIITVLKKIFKMLPESMHRYLKPKIARHIKLAYAILGFQLLDNVIGKAKVPWSTKPYLKKSFAQQGEDLILDRVFSGVLHKDLSQSHTYVDVGAYDPVKHSVTYLLYLRGWNGIVFDPSIETARLFKKWRKRDKVINAVVGETDGIDVNFFVKRSGAITQVGDQSPQGTKYPPSEKMTNFEKFTFRQVNLNDELKRQGIDKIDFLNMDVEGAELEILRTFDFEYFKPSIIAIEIHGNDLKKCLKTEQAKIILNNGYQAVGSAVITQFFARKDEVIE
jgi:FkbM family methyltransferase